MAPVRLQYWDTAQQHGLVKRPICRLPRVDEGLSDEGHQAIRETPRAAWDVIPGAGLNRGASFAAQAKQSTPRARRSRLGRPTCLNPRIDPFPNRRPHKGSRVGNAVSDSEEETERGR